MKIGELEQHCGDCDVIEWCAPPFDDLCLCSTEVLKQMEETEYHKMAEAVCSCPGFRYRGNAQVFREVCKKVEEQKHIVVDGNFPKQKGPYAVKVSANGQEQTIIGHWEPDQQDFMTDERIYFGHLLLIPLEWRPIRAEMEE